MKKFFAAFGIVGCILILGAAGMADTLNSEHMFKTLLAGVGISSFSAIGYFYYRLYKSSKIVDKKIKRLRAGA